MKDICTEMGSSGREEDEETKEAGGRATRFSHGGEGLRKTTK